MILDRTEMHPDELSEALFPQFLIRLGQGTERWLRQIAKPGWSGAEYAQAELVRRARLEAP